MAAFASISSGCNSAWRRVRTWRARLRRKRAVLALTIIVMLGLGEPLVCIVHCQIWLPFIFHSYFAAHQHHHHHHMPSGNPAAAQPSALGYANAQVAPRSILAPICELHSSQSDSMPFHIPPSPIHEMLPAFGLLLVPVVVLLVYLNAPPDTAPKRSIPPLLRPPIGFAV